MEGMTYPISPVTCVVTVGLTVEVLHPSSALIEGFGSNINHLWSTLGCLGVCHLGSLQYFDDPNLPHRNIAVLLTRAALVDSGVN